MLHVPCADGSPPMSAAFCPASLRWYRPAGITNTDGTLMLRIRVQSDSARTASGAPLATNFIYEVGIPHACMCMCMCMCICPPHDWRSWAVV